MMDQTEDKVVALLEAGADINAQDEFGKTALHLQADCGGYNYRVFELLVNRGTNLHLVDDTGITLLHSVAKYKGDFDNIKDKVLEALERPGVDVNKRTDKGQTSLHWAAEYGIEPYVKILLNHGANTKLCDMYMNTPLHEACKNVDLPVICQLRQNGAPVDVRNAEGCLPLHMVCKTEKQGYSSTKALYMKIFYELLSPRYRKTNINTKNSCGRTPLEIAISHDNTHAAEALLLCGARFDVLLDGTFLQVLCYENSKNYGSMLLEHVMRRSATGFRLYLGASDPIYRVITYTEKIERTAQQIADECRRELQLMALVSIDISVTLCDVIYWHSIQTVTNPLTYSKLEAYLEANDVLEKFPRCGPMVWWKFLLGQMQWSSMERAKVVLSRVSEVLTDRGLPDPCSDGILKNLKESDIRNIFKASIEGPA